MKALLFRHSLPREAFGFTVGRLSKRAYTSPFAPTMMRNVPDPTPPAADWVLCEKHAFEHYFDFAQEGLDLTPMITHRFPFDDWKRAVSRPSPVASRPAR